MPTAPTARSGDRPLDNKLLLKTLMAMRRGDFSARLPIDQTGVAGKIYDTLNEIIDLNQRMASEFDRVSTVVGKDGKITQRAVLGGAVGAWADTIGLGQLADHRPRAADRGGRPSTRWSTSCARSRRR
jgi:hypothetical protein